MPETLFEINARGFRRGWNPRRKLLTIEDCSRGGKSRALQQLAETAVACGMSPLAFLTGMKPTRRMIRWLERNHAAASHVWPSWKSLNYGR